MATLHPLALSPEVKAKIKKAALSKALDCQAICISTESTPNRLRCFLRISKRREFLFSVALGSSKASIIRANAVFDSLVSLADMVIETATEAADCKMREDHKETMRLFGKVA